MGDISHPTSAGQIPAVLEVLNFLAHQSFVDNGILRHSQQGVSTLPAAQGQGTLSFCLVLTNDRDVPTPKLTLTYVQCDERKPACLKCEKLGKPCPGFRDLANILFRDESTRVAERSRALQAEMLVLPSKPEPASPSAGSVSAARGNPPGFSLSSIQQPLSLPLRELAANFYFTHYSYGGPPLSSGFCSWVAGVYAERKHPLSTIIEAIGMSAISNTHFAPHIAVHAKENYGRVLAATTRVIMSPVGAVADTTLMAVLLLGLYEVPRHTNLSSPCWSDSLWTNS
jgi:hypothetical protein